MNIAFTLCSNNYLAQAKTLGDSIKNFAPDLKFFIGLVDRFSPQVDYPGIAHDVLQVEKINIPGFERLWKKYNIIELNTCVKASYFRYLFRNNPDAHYIYYFDPDIMVFDKLIDLEIEFENHDFILTPHILKPLEISENRPNEYDFLNYGIYNLGFLGLRNSEQITDSFLPWWEERTLKLGFIKPNNGLFVDQIWFNLVPLFYDKIKIIRHLGCNVAPWNLNERDLTQISDRFIVNNSKNLIFFHFSSFKFNNIEKLFFDYPRNEIFINDVVKKIYGIYCTQLIKNKVKDFSTITCYFTEARVSYEEALQKKQDTLKKKVKRAVKPLLPPLLLDLKTFIYSIIK